MKTFILLALFSLPSFASVTVISDLDDTIKITDAGNSLNRTWNGIFTEKVFTGMPEFFSAARTYSDSLHVVSAGPKILIRARARDLLDDLNIKYDGLHFRQIPGKEGKLEFKVRTILEIMAKNPGEVILLGDDVDLDPEVYVEVVKQFPERVLAVYIHNVTGRKIPGNFTRYWTSLDLILRENLAGRADEAGVNSVLSSLLSEKKLSRIIPKFADCPTSAAVWEWQLTTAFQARALELSQKLNDFCYKGK